VARRGGTYRHPLQVMRGYLDGVEQATYMGPQADPKVPVVLAALGPKMLSLAGQRTAGAHPYFVPVEHTTFAREVLGAGPFLAPEQAVVLETEPDRARRIARAHMSRYLALDNYANNLRRLGWTDDELRDGGSDRLVDAVVAWGDASAITDRITAHFAAGADHVSIQVLADDIPIVELEALAPALIGL
jgi:probable F420-dependent oxidoreductase